MDPVGQAAALSPAHNGRLGEGVGGVIHDSEKARAPDAAKITSMNRIVGNCEVLDEGVGVLCSENQIMSVYVYRF